MTTSGTPITLHRHALSGHAHRVELMLSWLGLPFAMVDVDLAAGEHKTPAFLAKNAFGQVPVIVDGDVVLADSNAILVYLASRYDESGTLLPKDPVGAARVQRWLSVAAGQLASGPALARLAAVFGAKLDVERARAIGKALFAVLESELSDRPYLAGDAPTIADLAMYTYTAHAPEGGLSLEAYPGIRAWLGRIEANPRFVAMKRSPVANAS